MEDTIRINELDKQVAMLKDKIITLQQQQTNLMDNFRILYNLHLNAISDIQNSSLALSITSGKLAESAAKNSFQVPQQQQQQQQEQQQE